MSRDTRLHMKNTPDGVIFVNESGQRMKLAGFGDGGEESPEALKRAVELTLEWFDTATWGDFVHLDMLRTDVADGEYDDHLLQGSVLAAQGDLFRFKVQTFMDNVDLTVDAGPGQLVIASGATGARITLGGVSRGPGAGSDFMSLGQVFGSLAPAFSDQGGGVIEVEQAGIVHITWRVSLAAYAS